MDPTDKAHVEAIDLLAKICTYGVYLQKLETQPTKIASDYQFNIEREVKGIVETDNPQTMQPFGEVFRDKVRIHALEVLKFDQARPIHKIHNARVLAKVAELSQPELADTLVEILNMKDPKQNDAVRYYILRGLKTLLAQVQPPDMSPVVDKQRQAKCAEAIVAFLEQTKGPAKNASVEEIDGFRVLRREGIRALSKIHTPVVNENDKVRPALVLARFAGNDASIQPPPRIDERVEAAIGLARMTSKENKQYQPDYAAGQIAKSLGAFALMYNNEQSAKVKGEMQTRPWRIDALKLKDALAALKTDSGKNAYVANVTSRGTTLLDSIIRGTGNLDSNELTWWNTPQSDPPSKELFQGAADSVVKPAQPAEAAPEK